MGPRRQDNAPYVSTGQPPSPEQARYAVNAVQERYRAAAGGQRWRVYPSSTRTASEGVPSPVTLRTLTRRRTEPAVIPRLLGARRLAELSDIG